MELQTIMKNIGTVLLVLIAGVAFGFFLSGRSISFSGDSGEETETRPDSGEYQEFTLSLGAYNYDPETITVEAGKPVRITADLNSLTGCFRTFLIPDLGIKKQFKAGDDTLEFTPTEKGSYSFRCSMGMGRGTLIVQ
ncbi:cupredoxin domain-containing protein [Candidatus Woesearchaeota archaeon]|nr:cupredoxin domain-containing protein [Candidatus Woesearchaeota archaeon]